MCGPVRNKSPPALAVRTENAYMWRYQELTQQLSAPRQGTRRVWCSEEGSPMLVDEGLELLAVSCTSSLWPMASLVTDPAERDGRRIAREVSGG